MKGDKELQHGSAAVGVEGYKRIQHSSAAVDVERDKGLQHSSAAVGVEGDKGLQHSSAAVDVEGLVGRSLGGGRWSPLVVPPSGEVVGVGGVGRPGWSVGLCLLAAGGMILGRWWVEGGWSLKLPVGEGVEGLRPRAASLRVFANFPIFSLCTLNPS